MNHDPRILFVTDRNYMQHTIVTLASILVNIAPSTNLYVYALSEDLTEEDRASFASLQELHPFAVKFIHVDLHILKKLTNMRNSWMTYVKLLSPHLLPELKRILYLDSDLVFEADITALWDTDLTGKMFTTVPDNPYLMKNRKKQLGMPNHTTYVNGGVLILNLDKMRITHAWERIQVFIKEWNGRELTYYDQYILNALFYDEILLLEYKWNFIAMYASSRKYRNLSSSSPHEIHYAEAIEPLMNYRDASMRGIDFAQSATSVSTRDLDRLTPALSLCDASIGEFALLRLKTLPEKQKMWNFDDYFKGIETFSECYASLWQEIPSIGEQFYAVQKRLAKEFISSSKLVAEGVGRLLFSSDQSDCCAHEFAPIFSPVQALKYLFTLRISSRLSLTYNLRMTRLRSKSFTRLILLFDIYSLIGENYIVAMIDKVNGFIGLFLSRISNKKINFNKKV